jgi:hypothetical protein
MAVSGMACPQGVEVLGSPWPPFAIRLCFSFIFTMLKKEDKVLSNFSKFRSCIQPLFVAVPTTPPANGLKPQGEASSLTRMGNRYQARSNFDVISF